MDCKIRATSGPPPAGGDTHVIPSPTTAPPGGSGRAKPEHSAGGYLHVIPSRSTAPTGETGRVSGGSPRGYLTFQLVDRAGPRVLVVAPAEDLRAVADPAGADVVEGDLDDELGSQRDPLKVA